MAILTDAGYSLDFEGAGNTVPKFIRNLDEQSFVFKVRGKAYTLSLNITTTNERTSLNFFVGGDYFNHGAIVVEPNLSREELAHQIQTQLGQNFGVEANQISLNLDKPIDWSENY